MRTAPEVTLGLTVSRQDPRALPRQISDELRHLVATRVLRPGEPLPSSRALAHHLKVSRGTVLAAYDQLLAEGYLRAAGGSRTVVNPALDAAHPAIRVEKTRPKEHRPTPGEAPIDLRPGRPNVDRIAGAQWRAAWRKAAATSFDSAPSDAGLPRLRNAVADHLRRMRGVVRPADQIVITSGGREGLALLLIALAEAGRPLKVGVEDPGFPSLRLVPQRLGAQVMPLTTDDLGLVTDNLPTGEHAPQLIVATPSHQYPLGGSLPIGRRLALLEWAGASSGLIVEDDYDSELRYSSSPLPALASLDHPQEGRVITLGTFAKTVSPGLGVGYLAAAPRVIDRLLAVRADLGQPVSLVAQRAMAEYLDSGELRRHTQRMRHLYRRRRGLVVAAFAGLPGVRVYPMDGGLHAVVEITGAEAPLLAAALRRGVAVSGLSHYWGKATDGRSGIVFGFGGVSDQNLAAGLAVLRSVCAEA
ncbi:MAG: PLP-dependent aminotransferase family protein [Micropruina sp.]|nr:PLP-dependent aminotransferase family protein [Micropruina sp.]